MDYLIAFSTTSGVGNSPQALVEALHSGEAVTFYSDKASAPVLSTLEAHGVENWREYKNISWVLDAGILRYVGCDDVAGLPDLTRCQLTIVDDVQQTGRVETAWLVRELLLGPAGVLAAYNQLGEAIAGLASVMGLACLNPLAMQPNMLDALMCMNTGMPLVQDGTGLVYLLDVCWRPSHIGLVHMPRYYMLKTPDTVSGSKDFYAGSTTRPQATILGLTREASYLTHKGPQTTTLPFLIGASCPVS